MTDDTIPVTSKMLMLITAFLLIITVPPLLSAEAEGPERTERPPSRGVLDIAIEGIDRIQLTQATNVYPGQKVRIDVRLVHDNRPYVSDTPISIANGNQFTVVLVINDEHDNVTTLWKDITSMGLNYTIQSPQTGQPNPLVVSFFWYAPTKPYQGQSWSTMKYLTYASITLDDDDKSDNYRSGSAIRISEPKFQPLIHEENEKTPGKEGPVHKVPPSEQVLFIPFQLWNEGPSVDVIGIDYVVVPEGWTPSTFEPQVVYPNNYVDLSLAIVLPADPVLAQAREESLPYKLIARPYSIFFPEGPYEVDSTYTFRFQMLPDPKFVIEPEEVSRSLVPNVKTDVSFDVRNAGNVFDTLSLEAYFDERASKDWKVVFKAGSGQLSIAPGDKATVTVAVTVPIYAAKNQNVNLYIKARSSVISSRFFVSRACTIWAAERYAAEFEEIETAFPVEPGKDNRIQFNFTNKGNDKDPGQAIVVQSAPKGWKVFIDQSPLKSGNGLGPSTPAQITMTVFVPETSQTSDKSLFPRVILQAVGGPNQLVLDSVSYYFSVPQRYKVGLTCAEPVKTGFVGGQTEFEINVKNLGNWDDTFNLTTDFKWATLEVDKTPPLFAEDSAPIAVTVRIPADAAADTNPNTPRVLDGYKVRITAYSQNASKTAIAHIDLTLKVAPFYSFEMRLAPNEKPLRFSTDHDEVRAVKVRLINTGNIADRVKLEFEDNPYSSWIRLANVVVDVPYGSYYDAVLTINPKKFTIEEARMITLTLKGTSQFDPDLLDPFVASMDLMLDFYTLKFDLPEVDALRINNVTFDRIGGETVKLDRDYSFQIDIINTGTQNLTPTEFSRMYVVLYDSGFEVYRANISYLPVGESRTAYFKWTASTPGRHQMEIALEGELPISERGMTITPFPIFVTYEPEQKVEKDVLGLIDFMPQLILMVAFGLMVFVFLYLFNKIFISAIDTGYDEEGNYRPWAVRERIQDDEKLVSPTERPELPQAAPAVPTRQLPPAPVIAAPARAAPVAAQPVPVSAPILQPQRAQPFAATPVPMAQQARPIQPFPAQPVPVQRSAGPAIAPPMAGAQPLPVQPPKPAQPVPMQPPKPPQ